MVGGGAGGCPVCPTLLITVCGYAKSTPRVTVAACFKIFKISSLTKTDI